MLGAYKMPVWAMGSLGCLIGLVIVFAARRR